MSDMSHSGAANSKLIDRIDPSVRALLGYVGLAGLFFAPLFGRISTHILADDLFIRSGQSDAYTGLWTYWWIQHAALLGKDLLHCGWVLPPTGADLLFHSTTILPTLLTLPMAKLFGVVAGYNLMVILMVVGTAWIYYYFASRTFDISQSAAFLAGALFGFCPYFIFKSHAHLNLIGGLFWGGALGLLLYHYLRDRFTIKGSILFALFLWGTFWTSFVEFFMLLILLALSLILLELLALRKKPGATLSRRLRFWIPAIIGGIPALFLFHSSETEVVSKQLFAGLSFGGLFTFPRLSILSNINSAPLPEYWGTYLPIVVVILGIAGILWMWKAKSRFLIVFGSLALLSLVLTLNLFEIPSTLLRALPMGSGFRVFGRFFPLFLFFFLVPVCFGFDRIRAIPKPVIRVAVLVALAIPAVVEYYPAKLSPSPVRSFHIESRVRDTLDRQKFVLVIPEGPYRNVDDTYQTSVDMPFVNLSYLAREDTSRTNLRLTQFPIIYGHQQPTSLDQIKDELRRLGVGYLLFETKARSENFPLQGTVVAEDHDQVLVDISRQL
jgi:hypothetical protein